MRDENIMKPGNGDIDDDVKERRQKCKKEGKRIYVNYLIKKKSVFINIAKGV